MATASTPRGSCTASSTRVAWPSRRAPWARELRALAPLTIAAHKVMLGVAEHVEEPPPVAVEARAVAWASADLQEGLAAFRERRTPDFRWR